MSRKNPSASELLVLAPWWVSAGLGLVGFVALRWVIPHFALTSTNPFFKSFGGGLAGAAPLALVFGGMLAILSAAFAGKKRRLIERQTSLDTLKSIHWQEFEWLVGEAYRRQGYSVEEGLSQGADGGVDVRLRKNGEVTLVQCKHRKSSSLSVAVVREIFGVLTSEGAHEAVVITTGYFTRDAHAFASGKPVQLIDGPQLLAMVKDVQRTSAVPSPNEQATSGRSAPAFQSPDPNPSCPKCGSSMVRRTAKRGANSGNQFWGCSTYPKCHAVVN